MYISFGQAIAKPNRVVILEGVNVERIAAKDKKINLELIRSEKRFQWILQKSILCYTEN